MFIFLGDDSYNVQKQNSRNYDSGGYGNKGASFGNQNSYSESNFQEYSDVNRRPYQGSPSNGYGQTQKFQEIEDFGRNTQAGGTNYESYGDQDSSRDRSFGDYDYESTRSSQSVCSKKQL